MSHFQQTKNKNKINEIIETIEDECFTAADDYEARPETFSFGEGVRRGASLALKHIRSLNEEQNNGCEICKDCVNMTAIGNIIKPDGINLSRFQYKVLDVHFCPNCGKEI